MTSEQISPSSSSISYQQTHIKAGDNILLRTPSGDIRSIQVHDRAGRINLGKFGSFVQAHLIGQPYGLSYEILPEGSIKMKLPESLADIEDTSATNELINDGKFVQPLTSDEIDTLKKTPGVHHSEIIKMQIAQNANYDLKTEYSKDKYKKRKEAKYMQGFSILEPTMFNICEFWFNKDPNRIRGIRCDTLAQMVSFTNARPGSRLLVVDDTGGLLYAACLERLGGMGRLLAILDSDSPPTFHIAESLNLNPEETANVSSYLNWAEAEEDYEPPESYEHEEAISKSQKMRRDRRLKREQEIQSKREELWAGEWDGLIMSTEYDPYSIISRLRPYLAGSAAIVVHSPYLQLLTELHQQLRKEPHYLSPSVTEGWLRQYQVLPGRTHPTMTTSGSGGYILTAYHVYDDETANSTLISQRAQRRAQRQAKRAKVAEEAAAEVLPKADVPSAETPATELSTCDGTPIG